MITKAEFEQAHAEKLRRRGMHVVACGPERGCSDPLCEGWAMVPLDWTNHRGLDGLDENFQPLTGGASGAERRTEGE